MDIVSAAAEGSVPEPQRIQFAGRGSEYFGIWIVNVLLSVVTFGIWTAWAKVRRVQYFNGRTLVLGDPLEYHATGWMIFKGRFLAFLVLIAFSILSNVLGTVHPAAPAIPTLTLFALYPWVINRSLRFSARMTSWRNVRFNWQGTYWGVTKIYFVWPLLGLLTLGACFPLAARALRHYVANNYLFGTTRFSARTPIGPYYVAFGWSLLFFPLRRGWHSGIALALLDREWRQFLDRRNGLDHRDRSRGRSSAGYTVRHLAHVVWLGIHRPHAEHNRQRPSSRRCRDIRIRPQTPAICLDCVLQSHHLGGHLLPFAALGAGPGISISSRTRDGGAEGTRFDLRRPRNTANRGLWRGACRIGRS